MDKKDLYVFLEKAYEQYNHRKFVHPDPLEFLYRYNEPADREVVGLIASSLAYGRVAQILKSVEIVLAVLGGHPAATLRDTQKQEIMDSFGNFRHRFTTGMEIGNFLAGIGSILREKGSLYALMDGAAKPWTDALESFAWQINQASGGLSSLLPLPSKGSACKRLMMFFRWMVRKDDVDPGDWHELGTRGLIIPLDTHMFGVARMLGFTDKRASSLRVAIEISNKFREIRPDDPIRYDFSLTRPGIRNEPMFQELDQ